MAAPIALDVTRLATRVLNETPNGIDRIDFAYARHFLDPLRDPPAAALIGPRAVAAAAARDVVDGLVVHWGEDEDPGEDESYRRVRAWICGEADGSTASQRISRKRSGRPAGVFRWIARHGFPVGRSPAGVLPAGARYLNISQFPLWIEGYFSWLRKRPDVRAVFFIHDLLPIETPEYFRKAEYERHLRRLANLARYGAAAIVTTEIVRAGLHAHMSSLGRGDMPILVAPMPVSPIFYAPDAIDPALAGQTYFVACGTIEPRKNHLILLHVWRELVKRGGPGAPKLVLIGARGWENENVVDLLERCRGISAHVIEVAGLSTPGLKRLLSGARALLMPSFAEGYGLPVAEAAACGLPVIASNIPVFQESSGGCMFAVSPIDGEKWLDAVRSFARPDCEERQTLVTRMSNQNRRSSADYFGGVEDFLTGLQ